MEKNERETHDFMNVESFSQLPFIRPAPTKEKGTLRLFGKNSVVPTRPATSQIQLGNKKIQARRPRMEKTAEGLSVTIAVETSDFPSFRLGPAPPTPAMATYPSWNNSISSSSSRFYGSQSSFSQPPINGSPLGLWRIPATVQSNSSNFYATFHHHHPRSVAIFAGDKLNPSQVVDVGGGGSSSQSRYVYESKPSVQEHVSLDLHL
ncbi:Detected protein of unknown function [Hibiscus syriacus]|uniref:Uncharacterized protein n=1 Tax=Hibiscus syriacus TaxID=106335 RepID=A0A6A3CCV7_HIBSY|nr:Detected protein of unknown function [Hibiscus syriacus]